jgi:hypothetical protein
MIPQLRRAGRRSNRSFLETPEGATAAMTIVITIRLPDFHSPVGLPADTAAVPLDGTTTPIPHHSVPCWLPVSGDGWLGQDWYELRAVFDRRLSPDEIARASGCIGYALRALLAGEDLSEPQVACIRSGQTVLDYAYDSTKSRRDDPPFAEAFDCARQLVQEGSPIRQTNRTGAGTRGTRLVEGIGPVGVTFSVR